MPPDEPALVSYRLENLESTVRALVAGMTEFQGEMRRDMAELAFVRQDLYREHERQREVRFKALEAAVAQRAEAVTWKNRAWQTAAIGGFVSLIVAVLALAITLAVAGPS